MHHTLYPFIVMFNIVEHPRSKFPLYYGIYIILLYHYTIILAINDFQQVSYIFLSLEVKSKSAACRVRVQRTKPSAPGFPMKENIKL